MIFLGIDPGIATTGFGVIRYVGSKLHYLTCGVIKTAAHTPLPKRLGLLSKQLTELLAVYKPDAMAVESLYFSTNAKTAMIVGQARGVILLKGFEAGLDVAGYTPLEIKSGVCGYGNAEKKQVQYMVKQLLQLASVPRPDDAADALAVAICHCHSYRLKSRV